MDPKRFELSDDPLEALLRASRPTPPPAFVASLQSSLFRSEDRARQQLGVRRHVLAGAFAALGMTVVAAILSLAGVGPLATRDQQNVRATSKCRYITVEQRRRVPQIVESPKHQPQLAFRYESVERRVKRCR